MAGRDGDLLRVSETLAQMVLRLAQSEPGGLNAWCDDYRFLCEEITLPEEVHFRRTGRYRLSSFAEAFAECYSNEPFMARYMNGLLMSNVFWVNHARSFTYFATKYLPSLAENSQHLEIGPGHGLYLHFAASHPSVRSITGWDVSPASIGKTRRALECLGARLTPKLVVQNLFDADTQQQDEHFDSVAMSEILEHLEDPLAALRSVSRAMKPGGKIFVNVPANVPAPDHLFLFEGVEHAAEIVSAAGLEVVDTQSYPMTGATLERARKHRLSVSCIVVGRKLA